MGLSSSPSGIIKSSKRETNSELWGVVSCCGGRPGADGPEENGDPGRGVRRTVVRTHAATGVGCPVSRGSGLRRRAPRRGRSRSTRRCVRDVIFTWRAALRRNAFRGRSAFRKRLLQRTDGSRTRRGAPKRGLPRRAWERSDRTITHLAHLRCNPAPRHRHCL